MPSNPIVGKTARKGNEEEDLATRRIRGEIACAECRRLKLKCDRKTPCASCVRRGCPSICPTTSLTAGQGANHRFFLADTSELHSKISQMGHRIQQLEDALAISHSGVSQGMHPLLQDGLLSIKFGLASNNRLPRQTTEDPIPAFGTLTINDQGASRYFGRSAGSETLILAGANMEPRLEENSCSPSPESPDFFTFLFPPPRTHLHEASDLMYELLLQLPEQQRAWSLCEVYLEHATWSFNPITREALVDDLLTPIYKVLKATTPDRTTAVSLSPHKLSTFFAVLSHGALFDLTLEPYNSESERYFHLSKTALSLRNMFDTPEFYTVAAVSLIGHYHGIGRKHYTFDSTWTLVSLAAKLAQALGLHQESSKWNIDAKTVQQRRTLFYELFCADTYYSLELGRPPAIRPSYIDCQLPDRQDISLDTGSAPHLGFHEWKYAFCREILSVVTELTLTAKPPPYETILDLDRKVRQRTIPPHLNVFLDPNDNGYTPSSYMRGCLPEHLRIITLMYIHRSFFAQAMLEEPMNPLKSQYSPSFLAASRCASLVIKLTMNHFERFPELCSRWWSVWTHLFSAAVIAGCIVIRSPSSSMAPSALVELGIACEIFQKGATHSIRARSGLRVLCRLKERALTVFSQFRAGNLSLSSFSSIAGEDRGDDELALFGGQTRVLFSESLSLGEQNNHSMHHVDTGTAQPSTIPVAEYAYADDGSFHTLNIDDGFGAITTESGNTWMDSAWKRLLQDNCILPTQ